MICQSVTRAIGTALVAGLMTASPGRAEIKDPAPLRASVEIPQITVGFSVGVMGSDLLIEAPKEPNPQQRLEVVRRALVGSPADGERLLEIGELYGRLQDAARAKEAYLKAAGLFRARLRAKPGDVDSLRGLVDALSSAGEMQAAEREARRLVALAPRDRRAWKALSSVLVDSAAMELADPTAKNQPLARVGRFDGDALKGYFETNVRLNLPPATLDRLDKRIQEAVRCADRGVEVAPSTAAAYVDRINVRLVCGLAQAMIAAAQGKLATADPANSMAAILQPASIADLQTAARLKPVSLRLLRAATMVTCVDAFSKVIARDVEPGTEAFWKAVPEPARRFLAECSSLLEGESRRAEPLLAAEALETLGLIQFFAMGRAKVAEATLRRALELVPERTHALQILLASVHAPAQAMKERAERDPSLVKPEERDLVSQSLKDLQALLEARIRRKDAVLERKFLAKLAREDFAKAESHVRAALRVDGTDLESNLLLAALLLKRADKPAVLSEAGDHLLVAETALQLKGEPQGNRDTLYLRGVLLALSGKPREGAQILKRALEEEPDDKAVKRALQLIGE